MSKIALVAIGGNSLISDPKNPDIPHQWDAVRETCSHLADMVESGWQLVITHGNGPQVGYILRRNELAKDQVHATPLDLIVADTQGSIGYMIQQALRNELFNRNLRVPVVSVITQVLVRKKDKAFNKPTKPIGSFLSEAEAKRYEAEGWVVVEDSGRGWRRVVASPKPVRIIEQDVIERLIKTGCLVIAAGGGGIPVVHNSKGELRQIGGVQAVIDKDSVSGLLARHLKVDLLLISTGVEKVSVNYNQPNQVDLDEITTTTLRQHLQDNQFPAGSMRPKIEAVVQFAETCQAPGLITNPPNITSALQHKTGTWIRHDSQASF